MVLGFMGDELVGELELEMMLEMVPDGERLGLV